MRSKKTLVSFFVTALTILLFSSCSNDKDKKDNAKSGKGPAANIDAYIVSAKAMSNKIEVPGSIVPFEETELRSEISERVVNIFFKEGATVGKGTLLVKLYDADLQAQLKKLQVQLSIAKQTEQRQSELLKINGVSQQDYDISSLAVSNIEADINILKTNISRTEIRAPFNGKIGLRNISTGAYISPQTLISTIRQINQLKLIFTVPERYGSKMQNGERVHFKIDGSTADYTATIIANENNISTDTRSLTVKAVVNSYDSKMIAGAFAKVNIELNKNEPALMIPSQAIIPQARNKKVIAYRSGSASMEVVTTGIRDSSMVEITSGLKAGDTVLITGLLTTKPGSKVKLNRIIKN